MRGLNDPVAGAKRVGAFLAVTPAVVLVGLLGHRSIVCVNSGNAPVYIDRLLPAGRLEERNETRSAVSQVDAGRVTAAQTSLGSHVAVSRREWRRHREKGAAARPRSSTP